MASRKPQTLAVTIRVDAAEGGGLGDIARRLEAAGLTDIARHERFSIINGSVSPDRLDALRQVAGVVSVREDARYEKKESPRT